MLHRISDFVNKIKVMNEEAHKLYVMKYHTPKDTQENIDNQIQSIQAMALLIAHDTRKYHNIDDVEYKTVEEKMQLDDGGW